MNRLLTALLRWTCNPLTAEAVTGDLAELYGSRFHWRCLWEVLSVCALHTRLRSPRRRSLVWLSAAAALLVLTGQPLAPYHYRINARDRAGSFTLEIEGRRVIAATLDGAPVHPAQVVQTGDTLVLKGGDRGRDFVIALLPGGIQWTARAAGLTP